MTEIKECDRQAFQKAIENNKHDVFIELLRSNPLLVNATYTICEDERSFAVLAASHGRLDMLKELISRSPALLNAISKKNSLAPIQLAAQNLHIDIVRFLIGEKARLDICDILGWNLIHAVVCNYKIRGSDALVQRKVLIELLIKNGLSINARDKRGRTPFYIAITNMSDIELLEILVKLGANPHIPAYNLDEITDENIRNTQGKEAGMTPLKKAESCQNSPLQGEGRIGADSYQLVVEFLIQCQENQQAHVSFIGGR